MKLYSELSLIDRKPDREYIASNIAELNKHQQTECHEDIHALIIHHSMIETNSKSLKVPYKGEKTKFGIKYNCNNFPDDLVRILCSYIDALGGKIEIESLEVE